MIIRKKEQEIKELNNKHHNLKMRLIQIRKIMKNLLMKLLMKFQILLKKRI